MTGKNVQMNDNEYKELVMEIKKELPNVVLPSMGLFDEAESIDIDGKEFILGNKEV